MSKCIEMSVPNSSRRSQPQEMFQDPSSQSQASNPSEFIVRPTLHELARLDFYRKENWFDLMCESLFKIKTRNSTFKSEVYCGVIHYISCLYCLAVIPQQLNAAGYGSRSTVVSVASCIGIGSIVCGLFSNLPFVLAPPTVVSIFLSVFLQQHRDDRQLGNMAVIISGFVLLGFGWRPLFQFAAKLIPVSIQVGTAVGIGLMTALAGSTEINLVVKGTYTILGIGSITPKVCIAIAGVMIICIAMIYHVKGSFCLAVVICSLIWWIYDNAFPSSVFAAPFADKANGSQIGNSRLPLLTVDLIFLYILYLNGLVTSLSNLAHLTNKEGHAPRARWVFIMSGVFTILSGWLSGPPMLISPESAASIKAGAKTGLSTVVCGVLFCLSVFLSPVFEAVPAAGTSPILIMIGVILFQNVARIDWRNITEAAPAFIVLFYIPFTYSVIQGVILGYIVYLVITLSTGDLRENCLNLAISYLPSREQWLKSLKDSNRSREEQEEKADDKGPEEGARNSVTSEGTARTNTQDSADDDEDKLNRLNLSMTLDTDSRRPGETHKKPNKRSSAINFSGVFDGGRQNHSLHQVGDTVTRATLAMINPIFNHGVHSSSVASSSGSPHHNDVENALHQTRPRQDTLGASADEGKEESKISKKSFDQSS